MSAAIPRGVLGMPPPASGGGPKAAASGGGGGSGGATGGGGRGAAATAAAAAAPPAAAAAPAAGAGTPNNNNARGATRAHSALIRSPSAVLGPTWRRDPAPKAGASGAAAGAKGAPKLSASAQGDAHEFADQLAKKRFEARERYQRQREHEDAARGGLTRKNQPRRLNSLAPQGRDSQADPSAPLVAGRMGEDDFKRLSLACNTVRQSISQDTQRFYNDYYTSLIGYDHAYPALHTEDSPGPAPFERVFKGMPLPEQIYGCLEQMRLKCDYGLFPEIRRAWMTVDSKLYLWNYETGDDFLMFDQVSGVIVSLCLANPLSGFFHPSVRHVLVVSTADEVSILIARFGTLDGAFLETWDEEDFDSRLELEQTGYTVGTDHVSMVKFASSPDGRVFAIGSDGSLFELQFQRETSWWGPSKNRCRLANHTLSSQWSYLTSFLQWSPVAGEDICIDAARATSVLWTRDGRNRLVCYELTDKGVHRLAVMRNFLEDVRERAPSRVAQTIDDTFVVVSMSSLSPLGSKDSHYSAVLTSSTGIRVYVTCRPDSRRHQSDGRQSKDKEKKYSMKVSKVLMPPRLDVDSPMSAAYFDGVSFLYAKEVDNGEPTMFVLCPDLFVNEPGSERFAECKVPGTVILALREDVRYQPTSVISRKDALSRHLEHVLDQVLPEDEFITQAVLPSRRFICMTDDGFFILVKNSPIDMLQRMLEERASDADVLAFVQEFGKPLACSMCLTIAAGSYISGDGNPELAQAAMRAFFMLGERPSYPQTPSATRDPTLENSKHFEGFVLSIGRSLRGFWRGSADQDRRLFELAPDGVPSALAFSSYEVKCRVRDLARLRNLLNKEKYASLETFLRATSGADRANLGYSQALLTSGRNTKRKLEDDARHEEADQLVNLHLFLIRSYEAWSLLDVMLDSIQRGDSDLLDHVVGIWQLVDPKVRPAVQELTLDRMCCDAPDSPGFIATENLINAMLAYHVREFREPGDVLASELERRCPSFFSQDDRVRVTALDMIDAADMLPDQRGRKARMKQALSMLIGDPTHTALSSSVKKEVQSGRGSVIVLKNLDLRRAVLCFTRHLFTIGVVRLALAVAHARDPQNYALQFDNSGRPDDDSLPVNARGLTMLQERTACYAQIGYVLSLLKDRRTASPFNPEDLEEDSDPAKRAAAAAFAVLSPAVVSRLWSKTLRVALQSRDELFHRYLYQWFLDNDLSRELSDLPLRETKFLDSFIERLQEDGLSSDLAGDSVLDLRWKHLQTHGQHDAAAADLVRLAEMRINPDEGEVTSTTALSLQRRIEYLVLANTAFGTGRGLAPDGSLTSRDVAEKLEAARVQLKILSDLDGGSSQCAKPVSSVQKLQALKDELNGSLWPLDKLHEIAFSYGMWESQLSVLHLLGNSQRHEVLNIWLDLIDADTQDGSFSALATRIGRMASTHWPAGRIRVFRLTDIIMLCEDRFIRPDHHYNPLWLTHALRSGGVPFDSICSAYDALIDKSERQRIYSLLHRYCDHTTESLMGFEGDVHLLRAQAALIEKWREFVESSSYREHDVNVGHRAESNVNDKMTFQAFGVPRLIDGYVRSLDTISQAIEQRSLDDGEVARTARAVAQQFRDLTQSMESSVQIQSLIPRQSAAATSQFAQSRSETPRGGVQSPAPGRTTSFAPGMSGSRLGSANRPELSQRDLLVSPSSSRFGARR